MMMTRVKTDSEIQAMRDSGQILANTLQILKAKTKPGIYTKHLSDLAKEELNGAGALPTFLGYQGYPDVLCVSINDEVVHGIPSIDKFIYEGDIVSLDFGVTYKGMITDAAISFVVGKAKPEHKKLVKITEQSLLAGINVIHDGVKTGDIGSAVEGVLNEYHYGVVRDLVGHGVGHQLHEDPNVPNYGKKGTGPILHSGMTIAVEPMATQSGDYRVFMADDGWTILTKDGSWAAHFEHTILITDDGYEILTSAT